jgi:hypothetical protein
VKIRRGRATVIAWMLFASGRKSDPSEAQTSIGTRNPRENVMTIATYAPAIEPISIPVREIFPWAVFVGLIALIAIYFVGAEQGATSIFGGMYIHEFMHDGRHLLGFPCH